MSSSSFQTITFADYLRILFQRIWIILVCVICSMLIAGYFAFFSIQKRFTASMQIRVYREQGDNTYLPKEIVPKDSTEEMIYELQERLRGEKRLKLLARNLRLYAKNNFITTASTERFSPAQEKALIEKILKSMNDSELNSFLSRLELVTLAKLTGSFDREIDPYKMRNDADHGGISEYLIDEKSERFLKQFKMNMAEASSVDASEITISLARKIAISKLTKLLSNPGSLSLFSPVQFWELRKEYLARDFLREVELYNVEINPLLQKYWAANLNSGLSISSYKKMVHLVYDAAHPSIKQAIPHLVVSTAFEILKAEYYANEEGNRKEAKEELTRQIKRINDDIIEINKKLANHSDLVKIQVAYGMDVSSQELENFLQRQEFQLPRVSTHITRMNSLLDEKRKLQADIKESKAVLEELIKNPAKARITKKTIRVEESPFAMKLNQEKIARLEELRKLLLDSTEKHPMVKKIRREIRQIDLTLSGLDREIESTVEHDNPEYSEWQRQLKEFRSKIVGLEARVEEIEREIGVEMQKAVEAPKRLQEFEDLQMRRRTLTSSLDNLQTQLEKIREQETLGKGILRTVFEMHRSPEKPLKHYAPNIWVIIGIGFFIGIMSASGAIFFIEYTDHSVKGVEDIKRYFDIPVLGIIPEFEFQAVEETHINAHITMSKTTALMRAMLILAVLIILAGGGVLLWMFGPTRAWLTRTGTEIVELVEKRMQQNSPVAPSDSDENKATDKTESTKNKDTEKDNKGETSQ